MRTRTACVLALGVVVTMLTHAAASRDREGGGLRGNDQVSRRHLQEDVAGGTPDPDCSGGGSVDIRFASNRLYAQHLGGDRGGCVTLTELYNGRLNEDGTPMGPVYILNSKDEVLDGADDKPTGRWLLAGELYIQDGITLKVWGSSYGGDADVLRIQSTSSKYFNLRGYGGSLSFVYTKVTSWDTSAGKVRESYKSGRSYISCVSEISTGDDCPGATEKEMGECRMDILSSEMGYLGYDYSESYGLTWKVRGFCTDLSNLDMFDKVNVYGDMKASNIHHNFYGMYTYGHQDGHWTNNHMHDNAEYGFDPHDDSDSLIISHNLVYDNGNHGIIASKRCNNLEIFGNEVWNSGKSGIYLHRSSDDSKVYDNFVHDNQDAGMSLMESRNCEIYDNKFVNNDFGIRVVLGSNDNYIHDNVFDQNRKNGLVTYHGSDTPWVTNGRSARNLFRNNVISDTEIGIRFNQGDDNIVFGNTFTSTKQLLFYESKSTDLQDNQFPSDVCTKDTDSTFVTGADVPDNCY